MQARSLVVPSWVATEYLELNSLQTRFADGKLLIFGRGLQLELCPERHTFGEEGSPTGRCKLVVEKNRCAIWLAETNEMRAIRETLALDFLDLNAWRLSIANPQVYGLFYDDIQPTSMANKTRTAIEQALEAWQLPMFSVLPNKKLVH